MVDVLTKEMGLPPLLEDVFLRNQLNLPRTLVNQVKAVRSEIRIHNIWNQTQVEV